MESTADAQVTVRCASVPVDGIDGSRESRAFAQISDTQVWLDIPDICRMMVSNGDEILVDAYEGADEQSIRLYVLGSGMGAILHQRGYLVLHANAIRVSGGVVLFAGMSGVGKSTTAAVFHQRGFDVISDDVVAVDDEGRVIGGFPQIKLWEDTLKHLDIPRDNLNKIRLQVNKYSLPLPKGYEQAVLPILAIYFLEAASEQEPDKFELKPLEGIAKFNYLKAHTYRRHFMEGLGLKPHHMKLCAQIAGSAHICSITRPTRRFNAPELADFVLSDLKASGLIGEE